MDEVTVLQARVTELEGQVRQLVAAMGHGVARSPDTEPGDEPAQEARRVDRRRALGLAVGAATAGVAAAALGPAGPAAAANGQPLVLGFVGNTATAPTGLAANHLGYGIGCTDRGLNAPPSDLGGAIFGHTKGNYHGGVLGYSEDADQVGVVGISAGGRAVEAWTRDPGGEPALFSLAGGHVRVPGGHGHRGPGPPRRPRLGGRERHGGLRGGRRSQPAAASQWQHRDRRTRPGRFRRRGAGPGRTGAAPARPPGCRAAAAHQPAPEG